MTKAKIDFSAEREDFLTDWKEIVKESPFLYENLVQLVNSITRLPDEDTQMPILLSYILCPSALSSRMPIMFLFGQSGTGKSQVGTLAAKLYNATVFGATSTFTSIRNDLELNRWEVDEVDPEIRYEQNYLLVWDDIEATRITPGGTNDGIFSLLKSGVNRSTSTIKIALSGGKNMEFNTFGGKIISSIHPVWDFPGLEELRRRALPITFKKMDVDVSIDVESIDMLDLYADNKRFWLTENRRKEYKAAKRFFLSKRCEMESALKQMWSDLMATLYVHLLQIDESMTFLKVQTMFERYADLREEKMKATILSQVLELFLIDETEKTMQKNDEFASNGYPELISEYVEISSNDVFQFLKDRVNDGSVEIKRIDNTALHQLMTKNGFIQKPSKSGLVWVRKI